MGPGAGFPFPLSTGTLLAPVKARPAALLFPATSSTRDGKARIISLVPLERFPFVSRGEE